MQKWIHGKPFRLFLPAAEISNRIQQLAGRLETELKGKQPVFLGILNGSFMFTADLLRGIDLDTRLEFVKLQSYQGMQSSGMVDCPLGLPVEGLRGQHVVILEDIVETGKTLAAFLPEIEKQRIASLTIVSLLFKPAALIYEAARPNYAGFEIDNTFIVGYGLDFDGAGRQLQDLWVAV